MRDKEKIEGFHIGSARTATILISLVAISAIILAIYALKQKREADVQTMFAQQKVAEARQERNKAIEQRINADSNREQALQQREAAFENKLMAYKQKEIADSEARKAELNRIEALRQQNLAQQQTQKAEEQAAIAKTNAQEVVKQQALAETQRSIALEEKQTSDRLKGLSYSRSLANESILLLNENRFDSSRNRALQAYQLNKTNGGPAQNNDIYNALNINWTKSINNKNQSGIHKLPVHCITGMPHNNILFTADESGMLCESKMNDNGLQKISSYEAKEEIRALAISPDGNRLVAITASGNGIVFKVSSSNIEMLSSFKFPGTGKAVAFDETENFILLSSKGIGKYNIANRNETFLNYDGINAFTIGKSGKLYIASGKEIKIYRQWENLTDNTSPVHLNFDSKVTSVAVDDNEQYIAAGTYNGFIWINDLLTNNNIWNKALHLSSVNDIKFATVDNDKLQLASAGADQTIKLIDVKAILQKNYNEDIITLKGHATWIYALYYTPDGLWLFSAGEDNKVIAWKPTMSDLYQTLLQ
ncbi:MAG TPA: hypothetical protein VH396_01825 [Chitinophagaceae bacterium]|jgi:WD40 repeat protein